MKGPLLFSTIKRNSLRSLMVIMFFTILGIGDICFAQSRVVNVEQLSVSYGAPPTVTFRVFWNTAPTPPQHRDMVWLFVDYLKINSNGSPVGSWAPATITGTPSISGAGTFVPSSMNGRGFYLKGTPATSFSSTVTVTLAGLDNEKFSWCSYATDYPPNATVANGYYALHGSPPFTINSTYTESSKSYTGGCITSITDITGCPGIAPDPLTVAAFVASPSSVCSGNSSTLTVTATDAASYSINGGATWQTSPDFVVTPASNTEYTIHVRNTASCTATYSPPTTITVMPLPSIAFNSSPSTVCAGNSITVSVAPQAGMSYCFTQICSSCTRNPYNTGNDEHTTVDCIISSTECSFTPSNSYTFTSPESGSVTICVTAMNASGCTASSCTVFTVNNSIQQPIISGASSNTCSNELAVTLTAISAGATSYTWYKDGAQVYVGTAATYSATATGIYTVGVNGPICSGILMSSPKYVTIDDCLCQIPMPQTAPYTFQNFPDNYAGTLTSLRDARDNQVYKVVKIDNRWWMAQNLNYQGTTQGASTFLLTWQNDANIPVPDGTNSGTYSIGNFWCPGGNGGATASTSTRASCNTWGALYSWETAMMPDGSGTWVASLQGQPDMPYTTSAGGENAKINNGRDDSGRAREGRGICPTGWHVPTDRELADFMNAMESSSTAKVHLNNNSISNPAGADAGLRGKATCECETSGACATDDIAKWTHDTGGTDDFDFSVIPSGARNVSSNTARFIDRGDKAYIWSSSLYAGFNAYVYTYGPYGNVNNHYGQILRSPQYRENAYSVRCIKNIP